MEKTTAPWIPDRGDGTYRNPVIYADYSDPDVIREGDWFYMTASSFNCTPGLPILRSADLVNWELIGHALRNVPHERYGECLPGCGVWAPAIRVHGGRFHIVFPTPDEGLYVVDAADPAGPWSEPRLLLGGKGLIDPCPLWDDDGKAYVIHAFAFSRAGKKSILRVVPVSPDLREVLGEGRDVISAMDRIPTLEGPKIDKFGGKYFILAPAGGVPQGYQMAFRSDSIYGPYEERILLAQGGTETNGPHQGSLVEDREGKWWFVHFQEHQPWGRIVHLQPARWEEGWPVLGTGYDGNGVGRPVLTHEKPAGTGATPLAPACSEDFTGTAPGLQWQWNANHREEWYRMTPEGLRLYGGLLMGEDFGLYPRLLCQKICGPSLSVQAELSLENLTEGDEGGLAVVGLESARLGFRREEGRAVLVFTRKREEMGRCPLNGEKAVLFVTMNGGGLCRFGVKEGEESRYIGPAFRAVEGRWIGARFGLYCLKGKKEGAPFMTVRRVTVGEGSPCKP